MYKVIIFGHRGAPGYPRRGENTIASFTKALASGATGLEFDVRRCGDGQIVVIHDETVERTTNGRGYVARLSHRELEKLDAGSGESIPRLVDVLDQFGDSCVLNIELKEHGLASDVQRLVRERNLQRHVIVSSFDWSELQWLAPEIPIALLASRAASLIASARRLRSHAIHPRKDIASAALIAAAHDAGLRVHVWTVNDDAEIARFHALGVDGIFTDFPERAVAAQGASHK